MEYAKEVERKLQRHMQEKDIPWELKTNPGPPKGCSPFWNCKGWFTTTEGEKVRYPRLGSFEVFVVVQPGFAPKTSGLPDVLQVWSKLQSRKWPDPERLASSVAELLSAAVDGQEVGEEIREIKGRVSQGPKVQPPLTSIHPPMFFGLTPRGGTPTPVEVRVAGDRSRSISPRPSSAFEHRAIRAASPTRRPSSAQQIRSVDASLPASQQTSTADVQAARPPEPVKALEMPPEDRGGDSAPPSFRPDGTTGTTAGNETTSMTQQTGHDPWDDDFEDETTESHPQRTAASAATPAPTVPVGPSALAVPPSSSPPSASPSSAGSATPSNKRHLEDLAKRLVQKYGIAAKPTELLKRPGQPWTPEALLDLNEFKSKLYHLGVFSDPYGGFNFAGLFKEMAEHTDRASLEDLIDGLQPFFEDDASVSASPVSEEVPAGRQTPAVDDYGEDEFEDEEPVAVPAAVPAKVPAPAAVAVPAPMPAQPPAPSAASVSQPKDTSDYGEEDFEDEESSAPAPAATPAQPAQPQAATPATQAQDITSDYGEDFESEEPPALPAASRPAPAQPPQPAKPAPKDFDSRMDSEDVSIALDEDERISVASPSRSASEQGGGMKHYQTDDFDEVASEDEEEEEIAFSPPRPVSPPKPAAPAAMPPSGPPAMAMPPSMPPEFGMVSMDQYDEPFEVQSDMAESISDDGPIYADKVSEGSGQHDYAENFDNYSDGIEEVPEVDSEGEDVLS